MKSVVNVLESGFDVRLFGLPSNITQTENTYCYSDFFYRGLQFPR